MSKYMYFSSARKVTNFSLINSKFFAKKCVIFLLLPQIGYQTVEINLQVCIIFVECVQDSVVI